jgi:hypothetical protein
MTERFWQAADWRVMQSVSVSVHGAVFLALCLIYSTAPMYQHIPETYSVAFSVAYDSPVASVDKEEPVLQPTISAKSLPEEALAKTVPAEASSAETLATVNTLMPESAAASAVENPPSRISQARDQTASQGGVAQKNEPRVDADASQTNVVTTNHEQFDGLPSPIVKNSDVQVPEQKPAASAANPDWHLAAPTTGRNTYTEPSNQSAPAAVAPFPESNRSNPLDPKSSFVQDGLIRWPVRADLHVATSGSLLLPELQNVRVYYVQIQHDFPQRGNEPWPPVLLPDNGRCVIVARGDGGTLALFHHPQYGGWPLKFGYMDPYEPSALVNYDKFKTTGEYVYPAFQSQSQAPPNNGRTIFTGSTIGKYAEIRRSR